MNNKPFERYAKYEVMKLDDLDEFLSTTQRYTLADIIHTLQEGRRQQGKKPCNSYVVVNEDEPYAEDVWMLIEMGKSLKGLGYLSPAEVEGIFKQIRMVGQDVDKHGNGTDNPDKVVETMYYIGESRIKALEQSLKSTHLEGE